MNIGAKTKVSQGQLIRNKLFESLHHVLYKELNKIGCEYVEHGESFIIGKTEHKEFKINIKIEVK